MSLMVFGWLLIVTSFALSALIVFQFRSAGWQWQRFAVDAFRPDGLGTLFMPGKTNQRTAGPLMMVAAVFLVVPTIGAVTSYLRDRPEVSGSADTDDALLGRLQDYASSIGSERPAASPADEKLLPDVNIMIEQLAARLQATPEDGQGWRMLGWSYLNTGRYQDAATAYAKAMELDPNSAELKLAYEEARAKASGSALPDAARNDTKVSGAEISKSEATPPHEGDAAIRSMVDGLANRLETSPRDVAGWTRLMRSRVVLGEREVAVTAFLKALDVFKDDSTASEEIEAAAIELGLKPE